MARITVSEEITVCDFCQSQSYFFPCSGGCGIIICSQCINTYAKSYHDGVLEGSHSALYCLTCDATLRISNPVFRAYLAIAELQKEYDAFVIKEKLAREHLQKLLKTEKCK